MVKLYCVTKRDSFLPSFILDVNECTVHRPCKNGGTCVNTVGDYNCQCPDNYKGKNCDEGQFQWCYPFVTVFCRKHAVNNYTACSLSNSKRVSFVILTDVDECAVRSPCKNGGKCQNTIGGYQCNCVGGWFSGKNCDQGRALSYVALFPNFL